MVKHWLGTNAGLWISCCLIAAFSFGCEKSTQQKSSPETPYSDLRQQVVDRVQKGLITPDTTGVASLPDDLKDAAADSKVITARDSALGLLVAFNLSINASDRAEYLLYAEKDIPEGTKTIVVGSLRLNVASKSKSHWYQAVPAAS